MKKIRMTAWPSTRQWAPIALLVFALLLTAAITISAQGEGFDAQEPDRDMEPVVVSQELMPNGTTQTQVTIPVSQNTYTTSNFPTTNWCGSNFLRLGYNAVSPNNGAERIYLKVDLSSIPSNATINWARFEIYQHTITPPGDSQQMAVQSRHLSSNWSQCSVTWSSSPSWGSVIDTSSIPNTIGWITSDATNLVRQWVSGQVPNNGALLQGDERVQERQRIFYSTRDVSRYPRMVVNYSTFVDNEPPQVSVESLPQWSQSRFTVRWSGTDPGGSGIANYDVEYQVNGGSWIRWISGTTATSADFVGSQPDKYGFRARGTDKSGNVQPWSSNAQASTTVDTTKPVATIDPLPPYIVEESFTLSWSGTDNLSQIKCYDVQYREVGGNWQEPLTCTTETSILISGAPDNTTFELRARATDNAGNVQDWTDAQVRITIETSGPVAYVNQFASPVTIDPNITVKWTGQTSPSTSIDYYDVQYRKGNGSWIRWLSNSKLEQATFPYATEDAQYCFEARAMDTAGRLEPFNNIPEACIVLNQAETIQPLLYVPILWKDAAD